jgi:carbamoyl-phosphate synthase large subunit
MNQSKPMLLYKKLLITGCGGDIAISIARILRMSGVVRAIFGCDIHADHPGGAFYDSCFLVPRCSDPTYWETVPELVLQNEIEAVIVTAESEIRHYHGKGGIPAIEGATVIMANREALEIGLDKLETAEMLKECGLPFPWTVNAEAGDPLGFPCILKAREGWGSKAVYIVQRDTADLYSMKRAGHIWQELLEPAEEEYTCGLYGTRSGEVRSIIFRRKLLGGLTASGEVVEDGDIRQLLECVACRLHLRGSINVQLRKTRRGPVVFEINPRFSSTVMFRHRLGFTDVLWSLQEARGQSPGAQDRPDAGVKFYRVGTEIIMPAKKKLRDTEIPRSG